MTHKTITVRLSLFSLLLHLCARGRAELFSAITELEPLLETQKRIIDDLDFYIRKEEQRLRVIKRYLYSYRQEHEKAMEDIPDYVGYPINAFRLIRRLTTGLSAIEDHIKLGTKNMKNITRYHKDMKYPKPEDLSGAAQALVRLQKIYRLKVRDLSEGILNGVKHSTFMTADDCFELGRALYHEKDLKYALAWMYEAYTKYLNMNQREREMLPYTDAQIQELIDEIKIAVEKKKHLLELYPVHERPKSNLKNIMKKVKKRYESMCRGEWDVPSNVSKRLKCWYSSEHHPFLKYAPIKVEQMYIKPDIFIFHEVLYDKEIEELKSMTKRKFRRSQIYDPRTNEYVPAKSRICKSGWFKEEASPTVARISRRVTDMTGLTTHYAEELQVLNYGIGGHYEPHYDFSQKTDQGYDRYVGNRIATVLFYMSDVEQGGATVFTDLGVSLHPIKGAAVFWLNLHPSGEGDMATRHAACPVIRGSKWVSCKWLHEGGQEFIKPCTLEYQPEGIQGKLPRPVPTKFS